jgi:hypothetical protein
MSDGSESFSKIAAKIPVSAIATNSREVVKKPRISPYLPCMPFGPAAKRVAARLVVTTVAVVAVIGGVSGCGAATHQTVAAPARTPSAVTSTVPTPAPSAVTSTVPAATPSAVTSGTPAPAPSAANWPQLHGAPDRAGYQPDETLIGTGNVSKLSLARTYQANAGGSAPLIANGVLYVVTNQLYAFDATGATGCSAAPATCTPLWTAPAAYSYGMAVANGDVFVTDAEGVQAYDAAGSANCSGTPKKCAPLWATSVNVATGPGFSPGAGSPVVANGVLYVPGYGDGEAPNLGGALVAAFDPAGKAGCSSTPTICVPMWTTTGLPASHGNGGSPAIANGVIYIANGSLYAFAADGKTGCSGTPKVCAPLWTAAMPGGGPTYGAPSVADGVVYVSTWYTGLYAFGAAGSVNCSTGAAGKTCAPLWTAPAPYSSGGTPAVAQGMVYVAANGELAAFSATVPTNCPGTAAARTCSRAPQWISAAGVAVNSQSSPAVANGVVYVTAAGGTYGYDAAGSQQCSLTATANACSPLWSAVTGSSTGGSPAVVNGVLFINVTGNGTIDAYSL